LEDILEALGTNLSDFFREDKEEQIVFSTKDFFVDTKDEYQIEWIIPNAQKNEMEPILLTLKPYGTSHEMESHQGEEFGYVLKGSVTLVRDNKKYKLKAKDTFYINGKKNHYLYNHTNSEAVILWVTTPPMF
jgi:quercetin dioxygenase-like cupin family protein